MWYGDQPLTCRRSGGRDHVAGGCSNSRCFNCEGSGHRALQCPEPPLCGVCLEPGHCAANCPFITFSGNIEERGTPVSYGRAAGDKTRPAPRKPAARSAAAQTKVKPPQKLRDEGPDQRKRLESLGRRRRDGSPSVFEPE